MRVRDLQNKPEYQIQAKSAKEALSILTALSLDLVMNWVDCEDVIAKFVELPSQFSFEDRMWYFNLITDLRDMIESEIP